MIIRTICKRGSNHKNFCEDSFLIYETETNIIGGIFDGCSSGKDSYFASKLFAYVLRKTINDHTKHYNLNEEIPVIKEKDLIYDFLANAYEQIINLKLDILESLSTFIFFSYSKDTNGLFIKFFGDGCVINGKSRDCLIIDENNIPNYFSYHMVDLYESPKFLKTDKFLAYYDSNREIFFHDISDISICSDGILSFELKKEKNENTPDPMFFLTESTDLIKSEAMLGRKVNILEKHGYIHADDLTIIRFIKE